MREILSTLGLEEAPYVLKAKAVLDPLLHARNGIAHGVGVRVDDEDYSRPHSEVISLLDVFRGQISEAAAQERYLR